jgi:hypothetical protein
MYQPGRIDNRGALELRVWGYGIRAQWTHSVYAASRESMGICTTTEENHLIYKKVVYLHWWLDQGSRQSNHRPLSTQEVKDHQSTHHASKSQKLCNSLFWRMWKNSHLKWKVITLTITKTKRKTGYWKIYPEAWICLRFHS